jgi:hypothetical protein
MHLNKNPLRVYLLLHLVLNPILSHGSPLAIDVQHISDEKDPAVPHLLLERKPPTQPLVTTAVQSKKLAELPTLWRQMKQKLVSGEPHTPETVGTYEIIEEDGKKFHWSS